MGSLSTVSTGINELDRIGNTSLSAAYVYAIASVIAAQLLSLHCTTDLKNLIKIDMNFFSITLYACILGAHIPPVSPFPEAIGELKKLYSQKSPSKSTNRVMRN
jgi:hypothetical protein